MRIAFIGAGEVVVMTARALIAQGHEVVIIEADRALIDELADELDCSFLHGDGSKPAILREVGPEQTDMLFCLSDNDQANLIASLVGRSLGFRRIVTSIQDIEFEGICSELGLENIIVPGRTISRYLVDMVRGLDPLELSTILKEDARFLTFTAQEQDAGTVAELDLPEGARVVCYYRDGNFALADAETALRAGDEVVILTHSKNLARLEERWAPKQAQHEAE
jgi:trk system potassium uptake protein TrkA